VRALADDLEHWLADEPVSACREPLPARALRWARRHRTTVATAGAAILVALAVGGSAWWWTARNERVRQQRLAGEVQARLDEANRLAGQARQSNEPASWSAAVTSTEGAWALAESGGLRDTDLRRRVASAVDELRRSRSDAIAAASAAARERRLRAALDEARLAGTAKTDNRLENSARAAAYREAFRDVGIDVAALDRAEALARLRNFRDRVAIAAALDDWGDSAGETRFASRLNSLARVLDPDTLRNRIREALARLDRRAMLALAAQVRPEDLPIPTLLRLSNALVEHKEGARAVALLEAASRSHPNDFWIHEDLCLALVRSESRPTEQAVRHAAIAVALRPTSPGAHLNLSHALQGRGEVAAAEAECREAIRLRPDLAEAHNNLGMALARRGDATAAEAGYRAAIRLKPDFAGAHSNLGALLAGRGDLAVAEAEYRAAIRLEPDFAAVRNNLGNALARRGDATAAEAEYRAAIRLKPDFAEAHKNLGILLKGRSESAAAEAEYRAAIRLEPADAEVHNGLGILLKGRGDFAAAETEYRAAIRLRPDFAEGHYNLGILLRNRGDLAGAEAEWRAAIRLRPDYAEAHVNLGMLLRETGYFAESLAEIKKGHELGSKSPNWRYPSAQWVASARRLAAMEEALPAVLRGERQPADVAERVALAYVCHAKRLYAAAARLSAEALAVSPNLASPQAGVRYNAACAAALAGCDKAKDEPPPDESTRRRLRRQAREWLRTDLDFWASAIGQTNPQGRALARQTLRHWREDADLAGLRDEAALARLDEGERADCRAHWRRVEAVLQDAAFPTDPFRH
jgi:Flp pilus assembly protein TadD